jgi:hypothetical protein
MSGAILPLPNTSSWRDAQLKHRDNFTFTFIPEGMRPLRRPMFGWEDNIKLNLKEMVCEGVEWIQLD